MWIVILLFPFVYTNAQVQQSWVLQSGVCPAGSSTHQDYNSWMGSYKYCLECDYGQYQDNAGQDHCKACPEGWSTQPNWYGYGATHCGVCPTHAYSTAGSSTCTSCPATENKVVNYWRNGCETCLLGQYAKYDGVATTFSYDNQARTSCYSCAPGQKGVYDPGNLIITYCDGCTPGYYAEHPGQTECTQCPAGKFQSLHGASSCVVCPYGQYNTGLANTGCIQCEVGKYQNELYKSGCKLCPIGWYQMYAGQGACTECPKAKYSDSRGKSDCTPCEVGKYQDQIKQSSCISCPTGRYQYYIQQLGCNYCPAGWQQPEIQSTACTQCIAGKFAWSTGNAECTECEDGQMSIDYEHYGYGECAGGHEYLQYATAAANPGKWIEKLERCSKVCTAFPGFIILRNSGSVDYGRCFCESADTSSSECNFVYNIAWERHNYIHSSLGSFTCRHCPLGKAGTGGFCYDCNGGKYQDNWGQTDCSDCPSGKTSPSTGAISTCSSCPIGYHNVGDACNQCNNGNFQDEPGQNSCKQCVEGRYSGSGAVSVCSLCPEGSVSTAGSSQCTECQPGQYVLPGNAACDACAPGKYQNEKGISECKTCPPGEYQDNSGGTKCETCPNGFGSVPEGTSCRECEAGEQLQNGACVSCTAGFFSISGISCDACIPGKYQDLSRQSECNLCPSGYFQGSTEQDACIPCSKGRFAESQGSSQCEYCQVGKFQDITGRSLCKNCPLGFGQKNTGQESCDICDPTSYSDVVGGVCKQCQVGKFGTESGQHICNDCSRGKYQNEEGSLDCKPCIGGSFSTGGKAICDKCQPGRFQPDDLAFSCKLCPLDTFQDDFGKVYCDDCPTGKFTIVMGTESSQECTACPHGKYFSNGDCLQITRYTFTFERSKPLYVRLKNHPFTFKKIAGAAVRFLDGSKIVYSHTIGKVPQSQKQSEANRPIVVFSSLPYYPKFPDGSFEDIPKSWNIRGGDCKSPVLSEQSHPYIERPMVHLKKHVDKGTEKERIETFDCEIRTGDRLRPLTCSDMKMTETIIDDEEACCDESTCCYMNTPIRSYEKCGSSDKKIGYELRCSVCSCFKEDSYGFWSGLECETCAEGYGTSTCTQRCFGYDGQLENSCSGYGTCSWGSINGTGLQFFNGSCLCGDPPILSGDGTKATLDIKTFEFFMEQRILSETSDYHFLDNSGCGACEESYGGLNCENDKSYCLYKGSPNSIPSNVNTHPCKCRYDYLDTERNCCPYGHVLNRKYMNADDTTFTKYITPLTLYSGDIQNIESNYGVVRKTEHSFKDGFKTVRCDIDLSETECKAFSESIGLEYRDYGRTSYGIPLGCSYDKKFVWFTDTIDTPRNSQGLKSVCISDGWDHIIMEKIESPMELRFTKDPGSKFIIGISEKEIKNISEIKFGIHADDTTKVWEYEDKSVITNYDTFKISAKKTVKYSSYDSTYEIACSDIGYTEVSGTCCDQTECCLKDEDACSTSTIYDKFIPLFPEYTNSIDFISRAKMVNDYDSNANVRNIYKYMACSIQYGIFDRFSLDNSNAANCYRCMGGDDNWIDENGICNSIPLMCASSSLCESPNLPSYEISSVQSVTFPIYVVISLFKGTIRNLYMKKEESVAVGDYLTRIRPGSWGSNQKYPSQKWCETCPGVTNSPSFVGKYVSYETEKFDNKDLSRCLNTFVGVHVKETKCAGLPLQEFSHISLYDIIYECSMNEDCEGYVWNEYTGGLYEQCDGTGNDGFKIRESGLPMIICESSLFGTIANTLDYYLIFQTQMSDDWDTVQVSPTNIRRKSCNDDGICMVPGSETWTYTDNIPGRPYVLEPFQKKYMSHAITSEPSETLVSNGNSIQDAWSCKKECDDRDSCQAWYLKDNCYLYSQRQTLKDGPIWQWGGNKYVSYYGHRNYCNTSDISLQLKCPNIDISGLNSTVRRCIISANCNASQISACTKCAHGQYDYCRFVPQEQGSCSHGYITGAVLTVSSVDTCCDYCDSIPYCKSWEIVGNKCVTYSTEMLITTSHSGTMGKKTLRPQHPSDINRHIGLTSYMYFEEYMYGLAEFGLSSCEQFGGVLVNEICYALNGGTGPTSFHPSVDTCQFMGPNWILKDTTCYNIMTREESTSKSVSSVLYKITTTGMNLNEAMCKCENKGKACNCKADSTEPFKGINDIFGCSGHGECSENTYTCNCDDNYYWNGQTCVACQEGTYKTKYDKFCTKKCPDNMFGEITLFREKLIDKICQDVDRYSIGMMSLDDCMKNVQTSYMAYKNGECFVYPVIECNEQTSDAFDVYQITAIGNTCVECNGIKTLHPISGSVLESSTCETIEGIAQNTPEESVIAAPFDCSLQCNLHTADICVQCENCVLRSNGCAEVGSTDCTLTCESHNTDKCNDCSLCKVLNDACVDYQTTDCSLPCSHQNADTCLDCPDKCRTETIGGANLWEPVSIDCVDINYVAPACPGPDHCDQLSTQDSCTSCGCEYCIDGCHSQCCETTSLYDMDYNMCINRCDGTWLINQCSIAGYY